MLFDAELTGARRANPEAPRLNMRPFGIEGSENDSVRHRSQMRQGQCARFDTA